MKLLAVTDTETTGLGESDQVIELAIVTLRQLHEETKEVSRWVSLVKPTCPVSAEARAAHHISDKLLAGAPTMEKLLRERGLPEYDRRNEDEVIFVAHVAGFDYGMLVQSGVARDQLPKRQLCTWRCALHLFPDAPSHKNQVLRYWLGLDITRSDPLQLYTLSMHRALPDALVTAALLKRMLEMRTVEELIDLSFRPAILRTVSFGKHTRGKPWAQMDEGFLRWILSPKRDFSTDVQHTARFWLHKKTGEPMPAELHLPSIGSIIGTEQGGQP